MSIAASLLPEFDHEMANTRKTLDRMPEDKSKYDWAPDPKSMPFMKLAGHLATIPNWGVHTLEKEFVDVASEPMPAPPTSKKELLDAFDKNVKEARAALEHAKDEDFHKPWSLKQGDKVIFTMPRSMVFRNMIMNHSVHHRAQLCVYYRLNGIPVPALYGPSADEQSF